VQEYFKELSTILYKKYYFGYLDDAERYVDELIDDIIKNLPFKVKRKAPPEFQNEIDDMQYASFPKSKNTTWFVFFVSYKDEVTDEIIYLICRIENNHTAAKYM
jgi:hypothetical protein